MKRFFSLLLISTFLIIFLLFSGCKAAEKDAKLSVDESLDQNYDTLSSQLAEATEFQQLSSYLSQWAKANNIDVKTSSDKYIVLSKAASAGYEDSETFTVQCSIDLSDEEGKLQDFETAAAAMALLYSAEDHGNLKAIFTMQKNGKPVGANALGDNYLKADNFVSLDYKDKAAIYNSIAASSEIRATRDLRVASPDYTKAYKLEFTGTPYRSPYDNQDVYPNGIQTIGDLLASCQSSSVLFELASFNGGDSSDLYPGHATAVIVLQENDVESFTGRFKNSFEKVSEYYEDIEEPFQYTMTETKLPQYVVSTTDTGNIVSLMYTITNGTYTKSDKGDVMAASNIGLVSTKGNQFQLSINAKSLENNVMDEMKTIFRTTCGLCDVKYKDVSTTQLWYASEKTPLVQALMQSPKLDPSGLLEQIDGSAFLSKKSDLNLAVLGMNLKSASDQLETLIDYMGTFGSTAEK